jgi:hypothetical protein
MKPMKVLSDTGKKEKNMTSMEKDWQHADQFEKANAGRRSSSGGGYGQDFGGGFGQGWIW